MPTDELERPTHDSGMVERVKDALSPLVNEDMGADMRDAWLTDLATAALEAAGIEELRKENERMREALAECFRLACDYALDERTMRNEVTQIARAALSRE